MNRLRGWSHILMWQIQDGGGPPSWISILGHNFGVNQHFCAKFVTVMKNRQPKGSQCSEVGFSKIQDGGRPPSWISILGHNFDVIQHFLRQICYSDGKSAAQGNPVRKQYTVKMSNNYITFWCHIFWWYHVLKTIEIRRFLTVLFKNKRGVLRHSGCWQCCCYMFHSTDSKTQRRESTILSAGSAWRRKWRATKHLDSDETMLGWGTVCKTFVWWNRQNSQDRQQGKVSIYCRLGLGR